MSVSAFPGLAQSAEKMVGIQNTVRLETGPRCAPSPVREQTGARSEELRPEPGARVST